MRLLYLLLVLNLILSSGRPAAGQSLKKMERRAINRTHLTFVIGDTVQRFTITSAHPAPRPGRFYYWQGPTQILRTAGAYDGKLLTGPYQLTSRNGNLLGSGSFHNGLKTGLWRTWRADGTPLTSSHWRQGKQRGKLNSYDEAGQLRKPSSTPKPTKTGLAAGKATRFWQLTYWKDLVKRVRIRPRHQEKQVPPLSPPATPAPLLPAHSGS